MPEAFAIIDIGKTNSRAILADLTLRHEIAQRRMENRVLAGPPYPHLDVAAQADFILRALADFAARGPVAGVMVIGHGATVALVDDAGLVLPVLDYEHNGPDELAADYDRLRPPFAQTGSPRMAGGLNIGAQLHWLRARFPQQAARAQHALFWPQFWTWQLTGAPFTEISYATSHSDLWSLADARRVGEAMAPLTGLFPPLAPAGAVAGVIRPHLAAAYGLPAGIPVHVGAHDSSLALVPHAGPVARTPSVAMSTGTWLTAFAIGVEVMPPDPAPGVMASLDIFGRLVPNFRFMAGKARADILGDRVDLPPRPAEACRIVQDPHSGTFQLTEPAGAHVRPNDVAGLDRLLAREAIRGMQAIGAEGPVHVTGPFATNPEFIHTLQKCWHFAVRPRSYEESLVDQIAALFDQEGQGR